MRAASETEEQEATSAPEYSNVWHDNPPMGKGCTGFVERYPD